MIAIVIAASLLSGVEGIRLNGPKKPTIEAWYMNMAKDVDRKECIEMQLRQHGFEPHRYEVVQWPHETKHDASNLANLKEKGLGDCVPKGIDKQRTTSHMGVTINENALQAQILSCTCTHKRLMEMMEKSNSTADYFLIFEDDATLSPNFREQIEDFATNYDGPWSAVQIDPYVLKSNSEHVKKGLKKQFKNQRIYHGGHASGSQATLIKRENLKDITTKLNQIPAIPADHFHRVVDSMIAWRPQIAMHAGHRGIKANAMCKADVAKKSIGRAAYLASTDYEDSGDEVYDASIEVDPEENGPRLIKDEPELHAVSQ